MDDDGVVTRQSYSRRSKSPSRRVTPRRKAVRESRTESIIESSVPSDASMTFPTIDTPRHLYGLDGERNPHGYKNRNVSSFYERKVISNSSSNGDIRMDYPEQQRSLQRPFRIIAWFYRTANFINDGLLWFWRVFTENIFYLVGLIVALLFFTALVFTVKYIVLSAQDHFYNKPPIVKEKAFVQQPPIAIPQKDIPVVELKHLEDVRRQLQLLTEKSHSLENRLQNSENAKESLSVLVAELQTEIRGLKGDLEQGVSSVDQKVEQIIAASAYTNQDSNVKSQDLIDGWEKINGLIDRQLEIYDADKLGKTDYASEAFGARIYSPHYTETYSHAGSAVIEVFVHALWKDRHTPRTMITAGSQPGSCWSMQGSSGYVVIELAMPILPTEFAIEHLSPLLIPPGTDMFKSTPKDFEIYAWFDDTGDERLKLGSYQYSRIGKAMQLFPAQYQVNTPVRLIELKILSNYGNESYTCIYRLRVHGNSHATTQ